MFIVSSVGYIDSALFPQVCVGNCLFHFHEWYVSRLEQQIGAKFQVVVYIDFLWPSS